MTARFLAAAALLPLLASLGAMLLAPPAGGESGSIARLTFLVVLPGLATLLILGLSAALAGRKLLAGLLFAAATGGLVVLGVGLSSVSFVFASAAAAVFLLVSVLILAPGG